MHGFAIPEDPGALAHFLGRLSIGLKELADVLEVSSAEIARLEADAAALSWAEFALAQAWHEAGARERYVASLVRGWPSDSRNTQPPRSMSVAEPPLVLPGPGIRPRVDALLERLVTHESWTWDMGYILGLRGKWTLSHGVPAAAAPSHPDPHEPDRLMHENEFAVGKAPALDEY